MVVSGPRKRARSKQPVQGSVPDGPPPKKGRSEDLAQVANRAVNRPPPGVAARMEWRRTDARRREELHLMRELRKERDAPVDSLFTASVAEPGAPRDVRAFHVFVAVFLSSQTRDEVTAAAVGRLRQNIRGGLTLDGVRRCRMTTLARLIKPVAFHNTKAENLKSIVSILRTDYDGHVPVDAGALSQLPGIGPKMAHIVVSVLTGAPQGIGIDVHVHRITNRLGWVKSREPEQTRHQLQKWLPYSEWSDVNVVMVGLGQQMNSAKPRLLQRCLQASRPVKAFRLLRRLEFDLGSRDKATGQGVLHWAAAAGDGESVRFLLRALKPHRDALGLWPWDVTSPDIARVFGRARTKPHA